jgi:hypothetical protein
LTSTEGPLSFTRWDSRTPLVASLAFIVLGSGAVLVTRSHRRRRHS